MKISKSMRAAINTVYTNMLQVNMLPDLAASQYMLSYNHDVARTAVTNSVIESNAADQALHSEFLKVAHDQQRLWVCCGTALGHNMEKLKLERFHARQLAARKVAGVAERVRKQNKPVDIRYVFSATNTAAEFPDDVHLPQARREFWQQKHMRQTCWLLACGLFHDCRELRQILTDTTELITNVTTAAAVTHFETHMQGSVMTEGTLALRKQFWKFVSYRLGDIVPRDLAIVIDIERAIQRETHNTTTPEKTT